MADSILTSFIEQTRAEPALAHDLLNATDWNLESALAAYHGLYDTQAVNPVEYAYDPNDFEPSLGQIPENAVDDSFPLEDLDGTVNKSKMDENEARRRELLKHQKQKQQRGRGLSFQADEVVDKFTKVAVSTQRVSTKEQVTIDEKFFHHSFIYPDFSAEPEGLQEFIAADLIEVSLKKALERSGRLNWWTRTGTLPSLEPLATSGDGNCLLHAASLYMWGFHDRELILRTALHRTLTTGVEKVGIKRRWKYHTQLKNDDIELTFSPEEWDFEWGDVVRIATNQPRQERRTASLRRYSSLRFSYESLEEVHVFALAHVLRRAIIVISDQTIKDGSGEDLAPIYFGGIYLPFEVNPTSCYKSPIVLGYDSSHFAPLVAKDDKRGREQRQRARFANMSGRKDTVIPLVTPDGSLLPVQFVYDPDKKMVRQKWAKSEFAPGEFPDEIVRLLEAYLDVRWIQLKVDSVMNSVEQSRFKKEDSTKQDYDHLLPIEVTKVRFPAAHIKQEPPPIYQKELIGLYLGNVRTRFEEQLALKTKREEERKQREDNEPVPCITEGCDMFGKRVTNNLCSVCHQATQLAKNDVNEKESDYIIPKSSVSSTTPNVQTVDNKLQAPLEYQWPVSDSHDEHKTMPKQLGFSHCKESVSQSPPVDSNKPRPMVPPRGQSSPSKAPERPLENVHTSDGGKVNDKDHSPSRSSTKTPPAPSSPSKPPSSPSKPPSSPSKPPSSPSKPPSSPSQPPSSSSKPPSSPTSSSSKPPSSPSKLPSSSSKPSNSQADSPKQSWAKKLKIPTLTNSAPLGPKKANPVAGGYSRDLIKPISVDSSGTVSTAAGVARVQCKSAGCEFFGSKDRNGYCSKCFDDLSKESSVDV